MADIKGTPTTHDFPEVKDKVVTSVEVVSATEGFGIIIRFHDETTLHFRIESFVVASPAYAQWEKGEETPVKRWPRVQSV